MHSSRIVYLKGKEKLNNFEDLFENKFLTQEEKCELNSLLGISDKLILENLLPSAEEINLLFFIGKLINCILFGRFNERTTMRKFMYY